MRRSGLRRSGLACAVVFVLALSGIATGATNTYRGKIDEGGVVKFKAKVKRGKPVQVVHSPKPKPIGTGFSFKRVRVQCKQGNEKLTSTVSKALKVNKRGKFHYALSAPVVLPGGTVRTKLEISGKFLSKREATGTLRYKGVLPHGNEFWTGCDSGLTHWSAKR